MTIGNNQMKPPMDRRQFVSKVNLLTTEQELDPRGSYLLPIMVIIFLELFGQKEEKTLHQDFLL